MWDVSARKDWIVESQIAKQTSAGSTESTHATYTERALLPYLAGKSHRKLGEVNKLPYQPERLNAHPLAPGMIWPHHFEMRFKIAMSFHDGDESGWNLMNS